jgi:hypothetical protein
MQAIGATLAGLTAQFLPTGTAMTMLAVASLAVTVTLSPGLRLSNPTSPTHADPLQTVTLADPGGTPAETPNETLQVARR